MTRIYSNEYLPLNVLELHGVSLSSSVLLLSSLFELKEYVQGYQQHAKCLGLPACCGIKCVKKRPSHGEIIIVG